MDSLTIGLDQLTAAQDKSQLVTALWDLRDSAYDEPGQWARFNALAFFQHLASELEQNELASDSDERIPVAVFAKALRDSVNPRLHDD